MPVFPSDNIQTRSSLLIWKLEESVDELFALLPKFADQSELDTISHPQKKKEWMASRILLKRLAHDAGIPYKGTFKDHHGKPFLAGSTAAISITNTASYVAAVLHPTAPVGIDMELVTDKLIRASQKFLSGEELRHAGTNLQLLAAYWCAKEAMFKLNGRATVSFRSAIHIQPFAETDTSLSATLYDQNIILRNEVRIYKIDGHCLAIAD